MREAIVEEERKLLGRLGDAITRLECGLMSAREVDECRHALREFYAEVFAASMLSKREKLREEVLGR